jgi:TonB family protein
MTKAFFIVIAISSFFNLHSQNSDWLNGTQPSIPQYPGGITAFYKFMNQNLIYPSSARYKGVEGEVVAQFIVNEQGHIEKNSIQVLSATDSAFAKAAIEVLKLSTTKWLPSYQGNKPVSFLFKIPFFFKLAGVSIDDSFTFLDLPIKGWIKQKSNKNATPDWTVYSDTEMNNKIGKISPDDSALYCI